VPTREGAVGKGGGKTLVGQLSCDERGSVRKAQGITLEYKNKREIQKEIDKRGQNLNNNTRGGVGEKYIYANESRGELL